MKPDRLRFPLSAEAEALLARPDWERVKLADGDAAQALAPGILARPPMPLHGPESGPIDDVEVGDASGDLFGPQITLADIEAARSPSGGWTRATLAVWGVPWPPPKGWKQRLLLTTLRSAEASNLGAGEGFEPSTFRV